MMNSWRTSMQPAPGPSHSHPASRILKPSLPSSKRNKPTRPRCDKRRRLHSTQRSICTQAGRPSPRSLQPAPPPPPAHSSVHARHLRGHLGTIPARTRAPRPSTSRTNAHTPIVEHLARRPVWRHASCCVAAHRRVCWNGVHACSAHGHGRHGDAAVACVGECGW
ncbi:hypothetical protein BCR44DRAFT_1206562 [Catenaria anguillulae PL171]|uniref:Uncharacterized protein n=1 Tax=Catenaria anguillulae PL171 TaxID=765915 RepID=A0A1Y2HFF0_9FUNG|nr:hypothetical protein BCR44DRAFT_1206562 [Catenaria anguillulae PL171]